MTSRALGPGGSAGPLTASPDRAAGWRWALAIALVLPLAVFWFWGDVGLSLQDEGFLWYGAQRVLAGEVPQRDFQAYDIARYYLAAAWMQITGSDGVMAMRLGHAVLASLCLALATLLVRSAGRVDGRWALLVPVTFWVWLAPYFKVSDNAAALILVAGLAGLLRHPVPGRWAGFGACLGLASTVGINHGAYGTAAAALAIGLLWHVDRRTVTPRALGALTVGGLVGYLPVIVFHLAVPGFAKAFVDQIARLFESGTTNIALPLPRFRPLWRYSATDLPFALHESLLAAGTVASLALVLWGAHRLWRRPDGMQRETASPVFVAALLVAVPYAHYFLSRADSVHAAVSAMPLLLAAWTCPVRRARLAHRAALVGVLGASAILHLPEHTGYGAWRGKTLRPVAVRGEGLRLQTREADALHRLEQVRQHHGSPGGSFYAAPYVPGAYAVAGVRSPVWEIYALFPALPQRQHEEIRRLHAADLDFALIGLDRVDGRTDLGLHATHPLIVQYLERCMRAVPRPSDTGPPMQVLVPAQPRCIRAS